MIQTVNKDITVQNSWCISQKSRKT